MALLSLISHKEFRYNSILNFFIYFKKRFLLPILPLCFIYCGIYIEYIWKKNIKILKYFILLLFLLNIPGILNLIILIFFKKFSYFIFIIISSKRSNRSYVLYSSKF